MSDRFYTFVRIIGCHPFWLSGRPTIIGLHHTAAPGAWLLACNHQSPYDVALLICQSKRHLDFVSITELFRNPLLAWFFGSWNAFPLDRSRRDPAAIRTILSRLAAGRVVAMFPEGGFRPGGRSIVHRPPEDPDATAQPNVAAACDRPPPPVCADPTGPPKVHSPRPGVNAGPGVTASPGVNARPRVNARPAIRSGIGRIAQLAGVAIVPCALINTGVYSRPASWLPLRRTRYAIAFGPPIPPPATTDDPTEVERLLVEQIRTLYEQASAASGLTIPNTR